eukprot:CAMPEP_0205926446 /NCGR_PEP_ID=MMETSP1325-20131115/20489_1 /ASSEMBLY_ACC=CAM_ASM_000708 /TAXON_ID=236786 /ORGANISM="Florenciella sp., Strain RCC1007" /LENGTH=118 /DNA_ID=CAMNT_0053295175 /DNA_START=51 /DNA_END=409 /DNA_ORIENTATION=+
MADATLLGGRVIPCGTRVLSWLLVVMCGRLAQPPVCGDKPRLTAARAEHFSGRMPPTLRDAATAVAELLLRGPELPAADCVRISFNGRQLIPSHLAGGMSPGGMLAGGMLAGGSAAAS